MKVEFSLISLESMSVGLFTAAGEDEHGEFRMLTLGFLLFSVDLFIY